jgi:hypothetical protein
VALPSGGAPGTVPSAIAVLVGVAVAVSASCMVGGRSVGVAVGGSVVVDAGEAAARGVAVSAGVPVEVAARAGNAVGVVCSSGAAVHVSGATPASAMARAQAAPHEGVALGAGTLLCESAPIIAEGEIAASEGSPAADVGAGVQLRHVAATAASSTHRHSPARTFRPAEADHA